MKNASETLIAIISVKSFLQARHEICNCGWNNDHRKTILDLLESSFSAASDELINSKSHFRLWVDYDSSGHPCLVLILVAVLSQQVVFG